MNIVKTIKLDNGVEFTAQLTEDQLSYLLAIAVNFLIARGSIPAPIQMELDFDKEEVLH